MQANCSSQPCPALHETPEHDVQAAFKILRHYIETLLEHIHLMSVMVTSSALFSETLLLIHPHLSQQGVIWELLLWYSNVSIMVNILLLVSNINLLMVHYCRRHSQNVVHILWIAQRRWKHQEKSWYEHFLTLHYYLLTSDPWGPHAMFVKSKSI